MPLLKLDNLLLADRYQIRHRLGQGSYAEICEAFDQQAQGTVIIKALNTSLRGTPNTLLEKKLQANFEQEARVLKTIRHPGIVHIFDQGVAVDRSGASFPYLVLEYLAGGTLYAHCRHAPLTLAQTIEYFCQVTAALTTAHAREIIHRDLTPANLLLSEDKRLIKVSDFGVAKMIVGGNNRDVTRVGTDLYAPPEHHPNEERSFEPLTPAADVYSLAKTIYFALTGTAPQDFRHQPIDRLPSSLGAQPEGQRLLTVLRRATATRVNERYASVMDFWTDFATGEDASSEKRSAVTRIRKEKLSEAASARNRIVIELGPAKDTLKPTRGGPVIAPIPPLKQCEFEIITVDATGKIKEQRKGRAKAFVEDLGKGVSLEMIEIPAGRFLMGSPASEAGRSAAEGPQHEVSVKSFFIGKYPITQAQWRAIAQLPKVSRALNPDPSSFKGAQHPIENVSWHEAVEFCERLSRHTKHRYRLPTEAEWEYACRAGTTTPFCCGATITSEFAVYDEKLPYAAAPKGKECFQTMPVGSLGLSNAFGLCDTHGNVWEWCADTWHDDYQGAPTDGCAWDSAGEARLRVVRGGSWFNAARLCRSAYRFSAAPESRSNDRGFRVVLTLT